MFMESQIFAFVTFVKSTIQKPVALVWSVSYYSDDV
jgi:hypothetical protein